MYYFLHQIFIRSEKIVHECTASCTGGQVQLEMGWLKRIKMTVDGLFHYWDSNLTEPHLFYHDRAGRLSFWAWLFNVVEKHLKPDFQVLIHSRHLSCWRRKKATHWMQSFLFWDIIMNLFRCMQRNRFSSLCFFALRVVVCVKYPVGNVSLWGDPCSSTLHFPLSTEPTRQWKWCQSSTRPEKKDKMFRLKSCLLHWLHQYGHFMQAEGKWRSQH